ncbi:hypothetical protein DOT_0668 [Desulfosporosinus sp. OT]|nr:hypothetical protein DOT_0668 [Desulfosporosinus sp. OT]
MIRCKNNTTEIAYEIYLPIYHLSHLIQNHPLIFEFAESGLQSSAVNQT